MKRALIYKDYVDNLNGEFRTTFNQIEIYMITGIDDIKERLSILNDLVELLLSAQNDDRAVKRIVGNNVENFCKEIIESSQPKKIISTQLKVGVFLSVFTIILTVLSGLFSKENFKDAMKVSINTLPYINGILIGSVSSFITKRMTKALIFRFKRYNLKAYRIMSFVIFWLFLIGSLYLISEISATLLVQRNHILLVCLIYIFGWILVSVIIRGRQTEKVIKSPNEHTLPNKISFKDDIHNKMVYAIRKKYNKKNKKFMAKENRPMNVEEAENWLIKDNKNYKIQLVIGIIISLIIFPGVLVDAYLTSHFLSFLFLLVLTSIFIFYPLYLVLYRGSKARFGLMKELEERELTIFDDEILRLPEVDIITE